MNDTIRTKTQLIETLTASPTSQVIWHAGRKPSAPGAYSLAVGASTVRVHATAVADCIKMGALLKVRSDFMFCVYRFRAVA